MSFAIRAALAAALALAPFALAADDLPVLAHRNGMLIEDGYARAAGANARTGAAFLRITNQTDADDRLVGARSALAERTELHTHEMQDGVARMRRVEEGIEVPAGGTVVLERGGPHVMFLGLTGPMSDGDAVELTLVFETAGEIAVTVPVDLERGPEGSDHGAGH